ncbi:MAG: aspartate kinase [Anaerolineae bacterium]|nr:aspartate kinase [Anaerolineae bacterium]
MGGSALGTVPALTQVLSIILHERKRWKRLILVASALDGVTDMLLESAHLAQADNQRGYRRIVATIRTRHLALVEYLPLEQQERTALKANIDRLLFEMLDDCQTVANTPSDSLSPEISDRIVGVGERLAARIIAALLRQNDMRGVAIDGTDIIVTNNVHGNASPIIDLTQQHIETNLLPMLSRDIIPVVAGYIGATVDGKPTTIGRGGSDYTASVLAITSEADEVWIWSDVDGMMSTDPRDVETAQVIETMSYDEVAELAYFGARILHARMIQPLQKNNIPLRVKNVYKPQLPGTLIRHSESETNQHIKAVTSILGIGLTANRSGSLSNITKLVDDTLFDTTGSRADVTISSQSSSRSFLCFIVPTSAGGLEAVTAIRANLVTHLDDLHDSAAWHVEPVGIVTAIGAGLDQMQGLNATILQQLNGIPIVGLAQGPSHCSLSIIVEQDATEEALRRIHDLVLSSG